MLTHLDKIKRKKYMKQYYIDTREKQLEAAKIRYRNNHDKLLRQAKDYYKLHREERIKYLRNYYYKNQEKRKESSREYNRINRDAVLKRRRDRKLKLYTKFYEVKRNGKCASCKLAMAIVLDFHHIKKSDKLFNISEAVRTCSKTPEEVENEMKKCRLLCANCHRIITYFEDAVDRLDIGNIYRI